ASSINITRCVFYPDVFVLVSKSIAQYIEQHSAAYVALGLLRWEDGKDHRLPQDFADMLGWRELAAKVDRIYAQLASDQPTLVLCDNYGQAGAINYYSTQGIKAVSFNADYVNRIDLKPQYVNLIRVKDGSARHEELAETSTFYQESSLADSIANPYAREFGTLISLLKGAKVFIIIRLQEEMEREKRY